MKNHPATQNFSDCQKSLALKNSIIYGIQIAAGCILVITAIVSIYAA